MLITVCANLMRVLFFLLVVLLQYLYCIWLIFLKIYVDQYFTNMSVFPTISRLEILPWILHDFTRGLINLFPIARTVVLVTKLCQGRRHG